MSKDDIDEIYSEVKNTRKRSRYIKLIIFLLIISSVGYFVFISNSPGQGTVLNTARPVDDTAQKATTKTLVSPYYTAEYPYAYDLKTNVTKGAGQIDLQVIQKPSLRDDPGSIRISYGVEPVPAGGVTAMSPYNLARAFPASYRIDITQCGGDTCHLLTKYDDDSSKIVLWPHGKNVLVVALSSQTAGSLADYDTLVAQILATLKWK